MKKFLLGTALALALATPALATIPQPNVQVIDSGNGSTTVFNYSFLIPFQSDGVTPAVTIQVEDSSGNYTTLTPSQYIISGVGNGAGGTVTYNPSGVPLPSGSFLIITRGLNYIQPIAVGNQTFYPHVVEQSADNQVAQIQQLASGIAHSILFPPNDTTGYILPPASQRVSKCFGFDTSGNPGVITCGTGGGGGGGSSNGLLITRDQIATTSLGSGTTILTSGYRTAGDLGQGCVYSNVGAVSGGWGDIVDSGGNHFNLTINSVNANPGCFGAYGDDGSHSISSGDLSANSWWRGTNTSGDTWDTVAMKQAIYFAFAGTSSSSSIKWNSVTLSNPNSGNLNFYTPPAPSGKYGINEQLLLTAQFINMNFSLQGVLDWQGSAATTMLYMNSASYGQINNIAMNSSAIGVNPESGAPIWVMDNYSSAGGLKTQQLSINNAAIGLGGFNLNGVAINPNGAGNAQGSTIIFNNPEFVCGEGTAYAIWNNGSNAIANAVNGGDFQGCHHDTILNTGGAFMVNRATAESQNINGSAQTPVQNQLTLGGWDFHTIGGAFTSNNDYVQFYREESDTAVFCTGDCYAKEGFIIGGSPSTWAASTPVLPGQLFTDSTDAPGHYFMAVDDSGNTGHGNFGWAAIGAGSTACVLQDSTASYSTNAYAGYYLHQRFFNGFTGHALIQSNTGTTVTMSPCAGFVGNDEYHIGGITGSSNPFASPFTQGSYVIGLAASLQGFSITANSTALSYSSEISLANDDWVVLPNQWSLGTGAGGSEILPGACIFQVTSVDNGAGTATMSTACPTSGTYISGYWGVPITDNQVTYIDLDFDNYEGLNSLQNVGFDFGHAENIGQYSGVAAPRADWLKGRAINATSNVSGNQYSGTYGWNDAAVEVCTLSGGTYTLDGTYNNMVCLLTADQTVVAPPVTNARSANLSLTFLSNGTPHTVTFGTGFATPTPTITTTSTVGAETTVMFVADAYYEDKWIMLAGSATQMPLYTTAGAAQTIPHTVNFSQALTGGAATITLTNNAVFTSNATYVCTMSDLTTPADPAAVSAYTDGAHFDIAGNSTDTIKGTCTGN